MTARQRIPVIVLSGGLGSGKTTLLNHLLRRSSGRIGVIINDFGAINIDAFLVRGHVGTAAQIGEGCLCCLADPTELDNALTALADPAVDLDVIVVEASGLAEPRALARLVVASEVRAVRFGGVVEVVDAVAATSALDSGEGLPVAADHLRVASLIVVNRADRVADEGLLKLVEVSVREMAPATPMVRTTYGRVDPTVIFDAAVRPEPVGQLSLVDVVAEQWAAIADADRTEHQHDHHRFTSVSLSQDRPIHPGRLIDLLESMPAGLYRVKGIIRVPGRDYHQRYVVQAVGGWFGLEEERSPRTDGAHQSELVAIGIGIDEAGVESLLMRCVCDTDTEVSVHDWWRFDRCLAR
ncbi:putative metal chaperone YciC [Austwickia sp. TVS 96-490-7B]|uniref:CobW family GTP-binding protein n=1 Tax=Austwickia sp. TVS 96-490-7B TaxID=2830843 RepID=UPI001C59C928|nr:GTP-binding protein [Austwickia sp. TVS 96-490-7B]MBW3086698.1 putative metal chaperone YciC [Austwickia sp. TVS 96-490-7B]